MVAYGVKKVLGGVRRKVVLVRDYETLVKLPIWAPSSFIIVYRALDGSSLTP